MSHVETLSVSADFEAPPSSVWNLLIDWPAIAEWMPDGFIQDLECDGTGEGAVRRLLTRNGATVSERLDRADEAAGILHLSMVGELPWGLLSYSACGRVEERAPGGSRLTWSGTLEMPDDGPDFVRVARMLQTSYARMLQGIARVVES